MNICLIFTITSQQCLEEAALRGLGFINIKQDPEKSSDVDICGDLFKDVGFCVDPQEIQDKLQNTQIQIKGKMNFQGEIGDLFNDLEISLAQKETEQKKIEQIDEQFNDKQNECFQAIQKVNMGALCYLASGNAKTNASVSANTIQLVVNNESTGVELEKCIPMYDALCLLKTGKSITNDTHIKSFENQESDSDFQKACETLRQFKDCVVGNCKERFKALIEEMRPTDLNLIPQQEVLNQLHKQFDTMTSDLNKFLEENFGKDDLINVDITTDIDEKVTDTLNDLKDTDLNDVIEDKTNDLINDFVNSFRRLEETSQYQIVMQSSENGENVVRFGEDSGVAIQETAKQKILEKIIFLTLIVILN